LLRRHEVTSMLQPAVRNQAARINGRAVNKAEPSGLGPSREPAGAWSARRAFHTKRNRLSSTPVQSPDGRSIREAIACFLMSRP
jgi:hypothetical protein